MSYEERDDYGMYKDKHGKGPGPELMGARTLIGDHVHKLQNEHLGVIRADQSWCGQLHTYYGTCPA
jgi:hypothetical protein